jgi:hypothetical protein
LQDRDTVSVPGAHQRRGAVARLTGAYRASGLRVNGGVSGQHFEADFPAPSEDARVYRVGGDLELAAGPAKAYAEYFHQSGRSVVDHPLPAMASADNDYWQAGAQVEWRWLAVRYNVSAVVYHDVGVTEILHQPGVTLTPHKHLAVLAEYVVWRRHQHLGPDTSLDHSLNLALHTFF